MGGSTVTISWLDRQLFQLIDKLLRTVIKHGYLELLLPDGTKHCYGSPEEASTSVPSAPAWMGLPLMRATVTVLNTDFFYKVIMKHDTGIAEAFMDRDFEVDDLGGLLAVMTSNAVDIDKHKGIMGILNWGGRSMLRLAHLARPNTIEGSKKNISEHYDAGNDMYKLFLDQTLTYSGGVHREGESLEQAQYNKLDALIRDAKITADSHVLEVGCGWGSCAIRAAQLTGCRWTGITVSKEQLVEAQRRVKVAGLSDRVTLLFCDYRNVPGRHCFDAVVSCEMIEAVGHEHLPTYFSMVGRVLKPGGLFAMQVITLPDERYEEYCNSSDFIRDHIFPGGHLPSMGAMLACAGCANLSAVCIRDIGPDYAITLREWRKAWMANWDQIRSLGYSDHFMRKYEFYFAYCEAPFDSGYIHNYQITWQRSAAVGSTDPEEPCEEAAPVPDSPILGLVSGILNDPLTLALVGVYFLLVGIAIGQRPQMWMAPITCGVCLALFQVLQYASLVTVPGFAHLSPMARAWWTLDCVHIAFSAVIGSCSFLMLVNSPSLFSIWPQTPSSYASLLVSSATGFFGFQLYELLHHNIHRRCPKAVLHFTVLLLLFGVCTFKSHHTGLLALTLPAELAAVPDLVQKMYKLRRRQEPAFLQTAKFVLDCTLRLLLHSIVALVVLVNPGMWPESLSYLMACGGLAYMSWLNAGSLMQSFQRKAAATSSLMQSIQHKATATTIRA